MKGSGQDRRFPMQLPSVYESDLLNPGIPAHLTLSQARRPQNYYNNQKYLGFVPLNDIFEGSIFGRFHGSRPSLAEHISQQRDGTFILNENLAQSWIRVEYALTIISHQIYNPLVPLNTPTPPYPSNTKYYESKPSLKRAIDSIVFAQKLFVFLIAELRHNIAISSPRFDKLKTTWVKYLETSPIGPTIDKAWLADLAASKAMTTPHLAGYFIDPTDMPDDILNRFRTYNQNGAPLYVALAKIDRSNPHKAEFRATLEQKDLEKLGNFVFTYQEAKMHIEKVERYTQAQYLAREFHTGTPPLYPPHISESPSASTVTPGLIQATEGFKLPESLPNSGQDHGKWWYEHLQDQREIYERTRKEESTQYRNEIHQESYSDLYNSFQELPEGFHAPIVYAWKPTPLHPDYLLRTPLERSEVKAYWSKYSRSHRIFDIYSCAWDLYDPSCNMSTLTREAVPTTVDDVEPTAIDAGVESHTRQMQNRNIEMPDLLDDRQKITKLANARLQTTRENQFYFENPLIYAHHRYGIILPSEPFHFNHGTKVKWWLYLGKYLQEEKYANMDSLCNALHCLMGGHSEHIKKLFDIYTRPRELIHANRVTIQRVPEAIFSGCTINLKDTIVRNLYLLHFPHSEQGDWVIGVNSAANVVLALRENWASHRNNLVQNFLRYGFEFLILILQY
jgi:hypothetical protein